MTVRVDTETSGRFLLSARLPQHMSFDYLRSGFLVVLSLALVFD